MKRINPEVVKAAAGMCRAGEWIIDEEDGATVGQPCTLDELSEFKIFDPMEYEADAWALERALKEDSNGEWCFQKFFGLYRATRYDEQSTMQMEIQDPSDTLLLLKVVAQIKGMELYL
jgi:hypothetical protein